MNPLISFPALELEISCVSTIVPLAAPTPASPSYLSSPGAMQWRGGGMLGNGCRTPLAGQGGCLRVWGMRGTAVLWGAPSMQVKLYACRLWPGRWSRTTGWGFAHARVRRQWVLGEFGACQCSFASPAPKISPAPTHLLLSPTPTRSSGSDGDSDVDSELEERVDGVKSWLSKNKGSSKALSDDGSLKGSRWVQGWAQGWLAEGRVSCAGGRPGWAPVGCDSLGAVLPPGACMAGQGRVNAGSRLALY